ncbi:PASTA domain-containing protein, partial [uncultured Kocuria sp.]
GTADRATPDGADPDATRVMGTQRGGPPTSPILPNYDPEATGTTTAVGARAGRQSGSSALRSPEIPRVRLNPRLPPLHVSVAVILFALLLTVAGFLGWWLGSAPGTASATVPAVAGQDAASAERALNAAGISNVGVRSTTSRDAPEGTVISTDPAASASVRGIEQVNLLVSEGPARVDVPTFTGLSADAARTAVTDAGLAVGTVTSTYSTQAVDSVVSQSPAAGASVDEGTAVDLTVAADSPQGDPPNVVGQSEEEARSTLEAKGYTVEVSAPVGSHLHRVVSQREEGDTVFLTVL